MDEMKPITFDRSTLTDSSPYTPPQAKPRSFTWVRWVVAIAVFTTFKYFAGH